MLEGKPVKHAVSVSEMAKNIGLSRQRLNQLIRQGKMPKPDKDVNSNRPFFTHEKQKVCLEIRKTGCGLDGAPILFYAPRRAKKSTLEAPKKDRPKVHPFATHLTSLGLSPTSQELDQTLDQLYPEGYEDQPVGEVVLRLFTELNKRANKELE